MRSRPIGRCACGLLLSVAVLEHDDLGANLYSVIQVSDVSICQAKAAAGHARSNGLRRVSAMNPINRAAEIDRASAKRVALTEEDRVGARSSLLAGSSLATRPSGSRSAHLTM